MPTDSLPDVPALEVVHSVQTGQSDCLAACAAMVLAYHGRVTPYGKLLGLLKIGPIGEFDLAWLNADNACAIVSPAR